MNEMLEYPKNRDWNAKIFSSPKLPRGSGGQLQGLRSILTAVKNDVPGQTKLTIEGSESKTSLDRLCGRIQSIGLTYKEGGKWKLTNGSLHWLESGDNLYLMAIFCSSIKFFGEILYYLDVPRKINEILQIAVEQYKINWKTKAEISDRLSWLREAGLVDFWDYRLEYSITEVGRGFLKQIDIVLPEEIVVETDETASEEQVAVSPWALEICRRNQNEFQGRKPSIGYIPGNTANAAETIAGYLQLLSQEIPQEEIRQYSSNVYSISNASSNMFVTLLVNLGFIERKTKNTYKISRMGDRWLETCSMIELLCCMHAKFLFVFEILKELEQQSLSARELAVIAKVSYCFNRESIDEMRRRLILLKEAKLIMEDGPEKFCLTNRGRQLLFLVEVQTREQMTGNHESGKIPEKKQEDVESLLQRARLASKDSSNPQEFEKTVRDVFDSLGFKSEWLGGPGKTDVLIRAQSAPQMSFKVAIDAKSTASGNVTENLIDFDTLKEHKKIHNADYTAVVGCSFQGERLEKRAVEHDVALIDMDSLEELVRKHTEIPLPVSVYSKIFGQKGLVDLDVLNDERNKIRRYGLLVEAIMRCLLEESIDPVTEGILSVREIYRSVRDNISFDTAPELTELEAILELLSSPLINCVGKNGKDYFILGSLEEASKKFEFYARACIGTREEEV